MLAHERERCVEACRERFKEDTHIRYAVNDGRSLEMVEEGSVDLVVSWDSLVHCEMDTISAYLRQLKTKLKPGGMGFIHHSNHEPTRTTAAANSFL